MLYDTTALSEITVGEADGLANRMDIVWENAIVQMATDYPAYVQSSCIERVEYRLGISVSPAGVRYIWMPHHDLRLCQRLSLWRRKLAQDGLIPEAQLAPMEKKWNSRKPLAS